MAIVVPEERGAKEWAREKARGDETVLAGEIEKLGKAPVLMTFEDLEAARAHKENWTVRVRNCPHCGELLAATACQCS